MPRQTYEAQREQIVAQVPAEGISHEELVRRLESEGQAGLVQAIAALVARGDLVAAVEATGAATPAALRYSRPQTGRQE